VPRTLLLLAGLFATLSSAGREASIEVDGRAYYVIAADFNRDGYSDLAVTGATFLGDAIPYDAYFLSLYVGDSEGRFSLFTRVNTGRSLIVSPSVGDINNNGFPDLVTPLEVFFDPGLFGFLNPWPVPLPVHARLPHRAATGDFNGDGRDDFAIADEQGSILFFTYDDDRLRWVTSVPVSHYPSRIITVDVDSDGISDVVTGAARGTVSILYMGPRFRFREIQSAPAGVYLQDMAAMRIDGGPRTAIIALDQQGTAFVYSTDPDAIALTHELHATGRTLAVIAEDVTGDGLSDVVIGQGDGILFVFELDQRGDVKQSFAIQRPPYAFGLAAADLNGDGFQDLVITGASQGRLTLLYGPLSAPCPTRLRAVRP
jgi:hypothetical protein